MKKLALLLLLVPSLAWSHPCKPCPPERVQVRHHTRAYPKKAAPVVVVEKYSAWEKVKEGFGLTAGFRWDKDCPTCAPVPVSKSCGHHDPAFVGAELRVPLDPHFVAFGNFDRDLVEGPDWNARVGLSYHPWKEK